MKHLVVVIYFLISINFCQAQRVGVVYYAISSDSLHHGHQIMFKDDRTLEVSSLPRHMSQQFRLRLNYTKTGNTVRIYNARTLKTDSIALLNHGLSQYLDTLELTVDGKALTDNLNHVVYVRYKDFEKKYYLVYLIDGKVYKEEVGLSDAYGLSKNKAKENKVLKDKMTSIKDDLDKYDVKIYKGLDAYKKFGYERVFGVIELRRKM